MITNAKPSAATPKIESFDVKILRQAGPGESSYWERFRVPYEPELNVIGVLQRIAAMATTVDGKKTSPPCWDANCLEEVCGSCTMLVNGHVRQACTALIDPYLAENAEIELRPMAKFPVVRDLVVDRERLFHALKKVKAWVPVDGYYDLGPGPRQSQDQQQMAYPLSQCMSCGCCLDACPQYTKIEVERQAGETDEDYAKRKAEAYDRGFIGAHAISQVMLFNDNPTGELNADERLEALTAEGGIQVCGNAQNCAAVCPKEIPLTRSIGRAGRAATVYKLKKMFDR